MNNDIKRNGEGIMHDYIYLISTFRVDSTLLVLQRPNLHCHRPESGKGTHTATNNTS